MNKITEQYIEQAVESILLSKPKKKEEPKNIFEFLFEEEEK